MINANMNRLAFELTNQYRDRIAALQQKITDQQNEILKLQEQIKLLSYVKEYDL